MDDIETARRILADPCGLMLPGNLGKALLARVDELAADMARIQKTDLYFWRAEAFAAQEKLSKAVKRIADLEASIAAAAAERIAEASRPALDRALDKLGYALDRARNGE